MELQNIIMILIYVLGFVSMAVSTHCVIVFLLYPEKFSGFGRYVVKFEDPIGTSIPLTHKIKWFTYFALANGGLLFTLYSAWLNLLSWVPLYDNEGEWFGYLLAGIPSILLTIFIGYALSEFNYEKK